jgi:signal transduction histidine kinase
MRERVEGLGGDYAIESERGRGTSLRVVIPLRATQNAQNDAGSTAAPKTAT